MVLKIKKIFCVLLAVVVTSIFCVIPVAADEMQPEFVFDDFLAVCVAIVNVYDSDGNLIDFYEFAPSDWVLNEANGTYYIDVSAPTGHKFFEGNSGGNCLLMFMLIEDVPIQNTFVLSLSNNIQVDYTEPGTLNFSKFDGYDIFYFDGYDCSASAYLTSSKQLNSFSFGFAPAVIVEDSDGLTHIVGPNIPAGIFGFFSNISVFFKNCVQWVVSIFTFVVRNSALLVLVIGFVVVGFIFGLLRKLIHSSG